MAFYSIILQEALYLIAPNKVTTWRLVQLNADLLPTWVFIVVKFTAKTFYGIGLRFFESHRHLRNVFPNIVLLLVQATDKR